MARELHMTVIDTLPHEGVAYSKHKKGVILNSTWLEHDLFSYALMRFKHL